jgi:hypothetical protein
MEGSNNIGSCSRRLMGLLLDARIHISDAESGLQITQVRQLFMEYAESLGFSLCFQDFDRELAALPGDYAPPGGRLLVAYYGTEAAGCIALHGLEPRYL